MTSSASGPPCPTCQKPAPPRPENRAFPFCCARCRTVDLGRWLREEYRIPVAAPDEADLDELERELAKREPS